MMRFIFYWVLRYSIYMKYVVTSLNMLVLKKIPGPIIDIFG